MPPTCGPSSFTSLVDSASVGGSDRTAYIQALTRYVELDEIPIPALPVDQGLPVERPVSPVLSALKALPSMLPVLPDEPPVNIPANGDDVPMHATVTPRAATPVQRSNRQRVAPAWQADYKL